MSDQTELLELERQITRLELDKSPLTFALNISRDYSEPWEDYAHLKFINQKVMALLDGSLGKRKLLITTPPRHGKSLFTSQYLPAWYLNKYPDKRIILCSYGDDFAAEWGRKVRDIFKSNQHKLSQEISNDSSAANRWNIDGHNGGMITAGVGGQITGRGAHLFIIDDPVKDAVEANSAADRNRKWEWWQGVAHTRLEPGGVVILIQTRWHEDDLAGRILAHEGELWEHVNLPALAEEADQLGRRPGDALCPERYTVEDLLDLRKAVGERAFTALYQQRPTPEGGGAFKEKDFRFWRPYASEEKTYLLEDDDGSLLVPQSECWRFVTADLAMTKRTASDYSVAAVWDVAAWLNPSRLILVHLEREQYEGAEHVDWLRKIWRTYQPNYIGVEEAQQGSMTMAFLQREGILVRPLKHKSQDKAFRAKDAELLVENHRVYFPRKADWYGNFRRELLMFPNGTHDDQVDAFSYAAKEILRGINILGNKPKEPERNSIEDRCWKQLRGRHEHVHPMLGRLT